MYVPSSVTRRGTRAHRWLTCVFALATGGLKQVMQLGPAHACGASSLGASGAVHSVMHELFHVSTSLASSLRARRHCMAAKAMAAESAASVEMAFDPRVLLFEFSLGHVLRQAQVGIVQEFMRSAQADASCVRQMIMGAGTCCGVQPTRERARLHRCGA